MLNLDRYGLPPQLGQLFLHIPKNILDDWKIDLQNNELHLYVQDKKSSASKTDSEEIMKALNMIIQGQLRQPNSVTYTYPEEEGVSVGKPESPTTPMPTSILTSPVLTSFSRSSLTSPSTTGAETTTATLSYGNNNAGMTQSSQPNSATANPGTASKITTTLLFETVRATTSMPITTGFAIATNRSEPVGKPNTPDLYAKSLSPANKTSSYAAASQAATASSNSSMQSPYQDESIVKHINQSRISDVDYQETHMTSNVNLPTIEATTAMTSSVYGDTVSLKKEQVSPANPRLSVREDEKDVNINGTESNHVLVTGNKTIPSNTSKPNSSSVKPAEYSSHQSSPSLASKHENVIDENKKLDSGSNSGGLTAEGTTLAGSLGSSNANKSSSMSYPVLNQDKATVKETYQSESGISREGAKTAANSSNIEVVSASPYDEVKVSSRPVASSIHGGPPVNSTISVTTQTTHSTALTSTTMPTTSTLLTTTALTDTTLSITSPALPSTKANGNVSTPTSYYNQTTEKSSSTQDNSVPLENYSQNNVTESLASNDTALADVSPSENGPYPVKIEAVSVKPPSSGGPDTSASTVANELISTPDLHTIQTTPPTTTKFWTIYKSTTNSGTPSALPVPNITPAP